MRNLQIGVIGSAGQEEYKRKKPSAKAYKLAEEVGKLIAESKAILICGGKGGVMESACKGAKSAKGITVGIVSGNVRGTCNKYIDVDVVSGTTNCAEESLIISMSDALIILGGGSGTLQEIATAYRNNKPMIVIDGLDGWGKKLANTYLDDRKKTKIRLSKSPEKAVKLALKLANIERKLIL